MSSERVLCDVCSKWYFGPKVEIHGKSVCERCMSIEMHAPAERKFWDDRTTPDAYGSTESEESMKKRRALIDRYQNESLVNSMVNYQANSMLDFDISEDDMQDICDLTILKMRELKLRKGTK